MPRALNVLTVLMVAVPAPDHRRAPPVGVLPSALRSPRHAPRRKRSRPCSKLVPSRGLRVCRRLRVLHCPETTCSATAVVTALTLVFFVAHIVLLLLLVTVRVPPPPARCTRTPYIALFANFVPSGNTGLCWQARL